MTTFKESCVIFDLDGVLSNNSRELHEWIHAQGERLGRTPDEWQDWYDLLGGHEPYPEYIVLLNMLKDAGHHIAVVTARPERIRQSTYSWLDEHCPNVDRLMMWDERTEFRTCKRYAVAELMIEFNVRLAIDNDQYWIDIYREHGIPALYVHDGLTTMV